MIQGCLTNVNDLCKKADTLFQELDRVIFAVKSKHHSSIKDGPGKRPWLIHKSSLYRLYDQTSKITVALGMTTYILQGVCADIKTDMVLSQAQQLAEVTARVAAIEKNEGALKSQLREIVTRLNTMTTATSSATLHIPETATKQTSSLSRNTFAPNGSSVTVDSVCGMPNEKLSCGRYCQCQCHIDTRARTPLWAVRILGSVTIHGNASLILRRRACNQKHCKQTGSLHIQITYATPSWLLSKCCFHVGYAMLSGNSPSYSLFTPVVIPYTADVWSFIELGKIAELRRLFSERSMSPYAVNPHGASLLKVWNRFTDVDER